MKNWAEIFLEVARRKRASEAKRLKKRERRKKQIAIAVKKILQKKSQEHEQHPFNNIKDEDDAEEPA